METHRDDRRRGACDAGPGGLGDSGSRRPRPDGRPGPEPAPAPKPAPKPAPVTATATATPAATTTTSTTIYGNTDIIPCTTRQTATPFQQWGDYRNYYLLQNGSFENGYWGWDLYGQAGIGWGNSPWGVWGGGQRSLWLGPNGTAVAPSFCADVTEPWVRFFYLASPERNARLKVTLTVWRGTATTSQTYWLPGGSGRWADRRHVRRPVEVAALTGS